ncbi:quinate permease [Colletotrichum karsti]|uniref:Quinate permease n=1 Tax=Colletotrichum karsti TaxID=1095194 RepID=A0A9P6I9P3_9PEZI|nr:quinate permease [Colletotrichum karsti]KAF9876531.1 quinate permease [Colletotrichum karsti]
MPLPFSISDDVLANPAQDATLNFGPDVNDLSTFLHIIELRRINADIYKSLHSAGDSNLAGSNIDVIRVQHHTRLNQWLVTAPRYLVPTSMHQTPEWFQIAYHWAIMNLYRPSHASPVSTIDALRHCADSSISLISCYGALYAKNKVTYTFVALTSLFMAGVTMLYSLRASAALRQQLTRDIVESNIRSCTTLLRDISHGGDVVERSVEIIGRLGRATLAFFESNLDPADNQAKINMGCFNTHAAGTNDPPEVRNWRIHLIALVASMSALAMGYDSAVIGGTMALDSFVRDFGLLNTEQAKRDEVQGNIVSTFYAGCFFGSLLTFPIAEKFGRKRATLIASCVFLLGGAVMTAANGNMNMIIGGRAVAGLGIGACALVVPVYIAETAPPSIRGRLIGIFEIASQGGGMLGFWINYAADQIVTNDAKGQWIFPLAFQLVPGGLLFTGMLFCPESPRWLARGDQYEAAERVLTKIRGLPSEHSYIRHEMSEIRAQIEERSTTKMSKTAKVKKLFQKGVRNRMGIGLALMFLQSFMGVNILTYYSPRIFETLGVTGTSTKLFSTGFYGVAKTLGMITFTVLIIEKVGRRKGMIWGSALGCIPMFYIGSYVMKANPIEAAAAGRPVVKDGWAYLAITCVYIHGFIITASWQGITWTVCSEIFPIDIRMLCVALTTADTWVGSFIIARTTPYMISDLGYGAYFFFSTILVGMGIWAFIFVPETKGVSLEEMDALFMKPTHKIVWAQIRRRPLDLDSNNVRGDGKEVEVEEIEKR